MENSKWKKILFKPLGILAIVLRISTSWYIAPIWAFCIPFFIGEQSIWLSLGMAIAAGIGGYKIWSDYDTEDDGQITIKELKEKTKTDLKE